MAETSGSHLIVDWFGLETKVFNMSVWTNDQDSHQNRCCSLFSCNTSESDHQKRSDIVHAIIHNRSLDHLGSILGSGWDVNETLRIPDHELRTDKKGSEHLDYHFKQRTALGEAARQGWTEGVRRLLDAGAKCKTPGASSNILILALQDSECQPDIIDLLLKHDADPNDHDGQCQNIPLLRAIWPVQAVSIVKLLLEHGADPNVIGESNCRKHYPLSEVINVDYEEFTPLLKTLVHFGADVNYDIGERFPLLHIISTQHKYRRNRPMFHQENLDLLFLHGGNINVVDHGNRTALEFAIIENGHSNSVRWLIRHGADISTVKFTVLKEYFNFENCYFSETPLILLQAGMRVSHGAQIYLRNMEMFNSAWLQGHKQDLHRRICDQLMEVVEKELQKTQGNVRKPTFPKYWTHQMNDLQEFSDESLQIYPEEKLRHMDSWQYVLDQIHTMLEFLSQPQSLQWYCRRCVRDNLVSLQPSVVKTLPGLPRLTRYILCHEI